MRPRGQYSSRAFSSGWDVVNRSQSYREWNNLGNAGGILMFGLRSRGPASTRATETAGSVLSRWASTHPADPAPTMT